MSALSSAINTRGRPLAVSAGTTAVVVAPDGADSVAGNQRSASCTYGSAITPEIARVRVGSVSSSVGRWAAPKGNRTVKVVPTPSWLSAVMVPPCKPTSSLTNAKPIPLPSVDRARAFSMRWKRSKSLDISAAGIPIPVSVTATTASVFSRPTRTVMTPSKVYFNALESRLSTTFSHI